MDRNLARKIILKIGEPETNLPILIDDLSKDFPETNFDELLKTLSYLAVKFYISIESKYAHECYMLEKYNKIIGFERDGIEAFDILRNNNLWNKVEIYLNENGYEDASIFTALSLAKKIIDKDLDKIIEDK